MLEGSHSSCHIRLRLMTSKTKMVLVSYLEKNNIPPEQTESDLDYLRSEFLGQFKFEANVKLDVTSQIFGMEQVGGHGRICDKDKLKAVVTPIVAQEPP